jgi:hypothetical protein
LRNEIHDVAALLRRAIGCTARGLLDRSAGRIWPNLREQRCWVHKTANILDKMPKSVQGKAKQLIHEMYLAPSRKAALAYDQFISSYQIKFPKACECQFLERRTASKPASTFAAGIADSYPVTNES